MKVYGLPFSQDLDCLVDIAFAFSSDQIIRPSKNFHSTKVKDIFAQLWDAMRLLDILSIYKFPKGYNYQQ